MDVHSKEVFELVMQLHKHIHVGMNANSTKSLKWGIYVCLTGMEGGDMCGAEPWYCEHNDVIWYDQKHFVTHEGKDKFSDYMHISCMSTPKILNLAPINPWAKSPTTHTDNTLSNYTACVLLVSFPDSLPSAILFQATLVFSRQSFGCTTFNS